jgi:hypothetical protein
MVEGGFARTDKKENQIFLKYKEIQSGAVAKSNMRKGFLIYEDRKRVFLYIYVIFIKNSFTHFCGGPTFRANK